MLEVGDVVGVAGRFERSEEEIVVTLAAGEEVVCGAAVERVVTPVAEDVIAAGESGEDVVFVPSR